MDERSNMTEDA